MHLSGVHVSNTIAHKPRKFKLGKPYETSSSVVKEVDVLVIGGGPAALGLLINAYKTNR
jgi:hypothetical protein